VGTGFTWVRIDNTWKRMEELKIPTELINMCKTCINKQEARLEEKEHYHLSLKIRQD
jgi:hypothetical protein